MACYHSGMDINQTTPGPGLSVDIAVRTLAALTSMAPRSTGSANNYDTERWVEGLYLWHGFLSALAQGPDAADIFSRTDLWKAALNCVGRHERGKSHTQETRAGDWDKLPGIFQDLEPLWRPWLRSAPVSSTEWPVAAVAALAKQFGAVPENLPALMARAFDVDSPTALRLLLGFLPMLLRSTQ